MGRLGDHPNIVTIHDMGEHEGKPYIVLPPMPGGDVEGLIKKAPEHRLPLDKAIEIARSVCRGLEFTHSKGIIHRDHGRRRQRIPLLRNSHFGLDKAAGRKEARCKEEYLIGGHNLTNSPKVSHFP